MDTTTQVAVQESAHKPTPQTGLSLFDKGNFDQLCLISDKLAKSPLIPESLKGDTPEETASNCLLVVEQSQRWGLSPFAVMGCASVIHGRLMWEGKLVAAVLEAQLGVRLNYEYSGSGDDMKVIVSGELPGEDKPRTIEGTVAAWKTTGKNNPWSPKNYERQLAYRGAREWARRHAPAVMLGVVTDDEELPKPEERDVTPKASFKPLPSESPTEKENVQEAEVIETSSKDIQAEEPKGEKGRANIHAVDVQKSTDPEKKWTRYTVALQTSKALIHAVTFSTRVGQIAEHNQGLDAYVWITKDEKGFKLEGIEIISEEEGELC